MHIDSKCEVGRKAAQGYHLMRGFVINGHNHWWALRRLDCVWFVLDSLNRQGPTMLDNSELLAHLTDAKTKGFHSISLSVSLPVSTHLYTNTLYITL